MKKTSLIQLMIVLTLNNNLLGALYEDSLQAGMQNRSDVLDIKEKHNAFWLATHRNFELVQPIISQFSRGRVLDFDGRFIVLVSDDLVRLFKIGENLEIVEQFQTSEYNYFNISAAAILGDKKLLALASEENDILLFDISERKFILLDSFLGDGKLATYMAFARKGTPLVTLNFMNNVISIFDLENNKLRKMQTIVTEFDSGPYMAAFSQNGEYLAVLCQTTSVIKLYERNDNQWISKDSIGLENKETTFFFKGDTLIIGDKEISLSRAIEKMNVQKSPTDGENTQGLSILLTSKSKTLTRTSRPLLEGKTLPNQIIKIYINDSFVDQVKSGNEGNFSYRVKHSLPNGQYKMSARLLAREKEIRSDAIVIRINKHPLKSKTRKRRK